MATIEKTRKDAVTLPFELFFSWLQTHYNCILRAGTPEIVVYDDEALHWGFVAEDSGLQVVQVLRGKAVMGEILIDPSLIAYVHAFAGDYEGEFVFELVSHDDSPVALYYFVLSHGYDLEDNDADTSEPRVH